MGSYADWAVRWRVPLHFVAALLLVLFAQPRPTLLATGTVLVAVGLGVRAWAAGHLRREAPLTVSGPYAHLRHPLYLGTAIILAGFAFAGGRLWLAVVWGSYFVSLFVPAMRSEERARWALTPELYAAYAARVPAFLPRLRPAPASEQGTTRFNLGAYRRNREWRAGAGCALLLIFLWGKMQGG